MDTLTVIPLAFFAIIFIVTLIEFLTGVERSGLSFFILGFVFLLIISYFLASKSSEGIVQKFAEAFAGLLKILQK